MQGGEGMSTLDDFDPGVPEERFDDAKPVARPSRERIAPPDRSPPHSAEAEEHVIACCLLDGGDKDDKGNLLYPSLARAAESGVTAEDFYFPANRLLFEVCCDLRNGAQAVEVTTLGEELKTRRQLEAVGGYAYLMQVTGKIPTTAHAGYFIQKVREKAILRAAIKAHTQAVEEAYQFTGDLNEYLRLTHARLDAVTRATVIASQADKQARLAAHRVQNAQPPKEPTTRLYLADKPIATPGNIVTLISKAKTGKTAALGAAVASIIAATTNTLDRDTFKFRSSNPMGHAVIVIDTEQSRYDAWQCYQRTLKRAGDDADPPWLHHYALVGYTAGELREATELALKHGMDKHGGVFILIIDGVADLAASVNDEAECNGLVSWIRKLTVDYDAPAICVIHSNEAKMSGDDGRGHLGKQLTRKAESNLLLKKTGEVTVITSEKQRKAPITEADGVAFAWSDKAGRHVICDAPNAGEPHKGGRPSKYQFSDFTSIFPKEASKAITRPALYRFASFRNLLNDAYTDGLVQRAEKSFGFVYYIDVNTGA
jgi:hypothetical protein